MPAVLAGFALLTLSTLFRDQAWSGPLALGTVSVICVATALRAGGRKADALIVCASVALAGALLATAASVWRKNLRLEGEAELIAHEGPLGWGLRPGAHRVVKTLNGRVVYDVVYTIDARGRRRTRSAATGPVMAFLGDSFTFGEGVPDQDTLPQAFADLTGSRVVNLGVSAYSPAQVLRELQLGLDDDVLKSSKALFMLTAPWHIDRVACLDDWVVGAPRFVLRGGSLFADGQCPLPELGPLQALWQQTPIYRAFFSGKLPFVSERDIATYIAVVVETGRIAKLKYGVPLEILYLRNAGYLRFTRTSDDDIIRQLRAGGVDVLEMTLPREGKTGFAIAGDGHPNGAGDRMRAKMLVEALAMHAPDLLRPKPPLHQ